MMGSVTMYTYIVINDARRQYWVADAQYTGKINNYRDILKKQYGETKIRWFQTTAEFLHKDLEPEHYREYTRGHYSDWITEIKGDTDGNI